jgi:hypothetical protein
MVKRKGTNSDLQNTHRKLKIKQREPTKPGGELVCSGRVCSFCSTNDTHLVTLVKKSVISESLGV